MLKSLLIRNYALIRELEITPSAHLNIITGETGAGKSIILGAVGLLLGNRAEGRSLLNEEEKCVVECVFDVKGYPVKSVFEEAEIDYEDSCIIRREISPAGKSRAFINDTPCTLDTLKLLGSRLMDIHSQHDSVQLGSNAYQLSILDTYGELQSQTSAYRLTYEAWRKADQVFRKLEEESKKDKKELDYNLFQLKELNKAKLVSGEQESLEAELNLLENAEEIRQRLGESVELLDSGEDTVISRLRTVKTNLSRLSEYGENFSKLSERTESVWLELRDIAGELDAIAEGIETDTTRSEEINERLSLLFSLQKKHGVADSEGLIEIRNQLAAQTAGLENMEESIAAAREKADALHLEAKALAETLTNARLAAVPVLQSELIGLFTDVGMPNATIRIDRQAAALSPTGADTIAFLFTANKGMSPRELRNVASGGEFSRLMLCIKYILAGKTHLPTIIFDEIDTGISGETAVKVGRMMERMSQRHQLIAITHLPQIAARASAHYYVYKDHSDVKTVSHIRLLNNKEQVNEIAGMISGTAPTAASLASAEELMGSRVK
ncbi:MAG: DNA repair protein RecN [Bacteroidota bacterium]